jgi:predicted AAA+ superfamily ATPase
MAIKRVVDIDNARGQFLLTGSANILTLPKIVDALPGRIDYLTLWPFSQRELIGPRGVFLENALAGRAPSVGAAPVGRPGYAEQIVRGGFPEVVQAGASGRGRFFSGYIDSILGREASELASIRNTQTAARVLRLAAARSAALTNHSSIGRELGIDHKTVASHLRVLEQLFLVVQLPAWHSNLGHRVVRTSKLHIADSGMLCSLIGADTRRLEADGGLAGSVFESFAVSEVIRQASVSDIGHLLSLHHDSAW